MTQTTRTTRSTRLLLALALAAVCLSAGTAAQSGPKNGSMIQRDTEIARPEAGTHNGGGQTVGFTYFAGAKDLKITFRKRVLKPGSAIGMHRQDVDEIYYVISGKGLLTLDGTDTEVGPGTGILTRPGSTHALKQMGQDDLVIIINYEEPLPAAR